MMVDQHVITGIDLRLCASNGLGKTLFFSRPFCICPFPSSVAREKKGVKKEARGRGSRYNSTKEPKILDRCSKLEEC